MVFRMELINIQVNSSPCCRFFLPTSFFSQFIQCSLQACYLSPWRKFLLVSQLSSAYSMAVILILPNQLTLTEYSSQKNQLQRPLSYRHPVIVILQALSPQLIVRSFFSTFQKKKRNSHPFHLFYFWRIVLSLFARIAKVPNIDPTQMRHRRASSASTSDRGLSRSSSTTSIRQSPNILASSPSSLSPLESARNSVPGIVLDPLQVGSQRKKEKRRSVI